MAIPVTPEEQIENDLITQLTQGDSQWTYEPEIKNEDDLWNNFFRILEQNNLGRLEGILLTEDEKSQIREQLNFATFYDAGVWLAGENGIAQVRVQRSDAQLGTIHLNVHNANNIAGGSSVYQVVHQIQRDKQSSTDRNRRTDVSLLINGMPLLHIELKSRAHSIKEAFEQIKTYDAEKKFTGIYSMIQVFILSNGSNTQYISAARQYDLDPNYLTTWVDKDNNRIRDLNKFAQQVLNIPMGHELVTDYTVLDSKSKSLIALRPYQIHATKAILESAKKDESGHIWHTTGSGKTLTSYKVSKTLLRRKSLDKVLFLVDRKDLDVQTTNTFQAYAENDTIEVDDTANVTSLVNKLLSGEREVLITTAQKLGHLLKRYNSNIRELTKKEEETRKKLRRLNIAFVVDECHRAVSAEQKRNIDRFFTQPVKLWYGFTGTPIFIPKNVKGDLEATTEEQYGPSLHIYTIKEAIHDGNVLPFHVEYIDSLREDSIYDYLTKQVKFSPEQVEGMSHMEREKYINKNVYDEEGHMLTVIDQVINRSKTKLGLGRGSGQSYCGVLTVESIAKAQRYYKLFKKVLNGEVEGYGVSQNIQESIADFPKIAITYSLSENQGDSYENQQAMAEAIKDYNAMFDTNFSLESVDAYNRDLTNRLARKSTKFQVRKEQIDIVIVVDRLLTGFDAPTLSTLFMDRPIMPPHSMIQAFSRTNRLYKKKKANIVTFRTPETYREEVREAIRMYSFGAEPEEVMAPEWKEAKAKMSQAVNNLHKVTTSIENILDESTTDEKKKQFAKAFQELDAAFNDLEVYDDYIDESEGRPNYLKETFGVSVDELEEYYAVYVDVIAQLRANREDDDNELEVDIEYELASRYREEIDYEYILALMDRHQDKGLSEEETNEVDRYITELTKANPQLGQLLEQVWKDIQNHEEEVQNQRAIDVLEGYKHRYINNFIDDLAKSWNVDEDEVTYLVSRFRAGNENNQEGWANVAEQIRANFDSDHGYPTNERVNRLNIKRVAKEYIYSEILNEIEPIK